MLKKNIQINSKLQFEPWQIDLTTHLDFFTSQQDSFFVQPLEKNKNDQPHFSQGQEKHIPPQINNVKLKYHQNKFSIVKIDPSEIYKKPLKHSKPSQSFQCGNINKIQTIFKQISSKSINRKSESTSFSVKNNIVDKKMIHKKRQSSFKSSSLNNSNQNCLFWIDKENGVKNNKIMNNFNINDFDQLHSQKVKYLKKKTIQKQSKQQFHQNDHIAQTSGVLPPLVSNCISNCINLIQNQILNNNQNYDKLQNQQLPKPQIKRHRHKKSDAMLSLKNLRQQAFKKQLKKQELGIFDQNYIINQDTFKKSRSQDFSSQVLECFENITQTAQQKLQYQRKRKLLLIKSCQQSPTLIQSKSPNLFDVPSTKNTIISQYLKIKEQKKKEQQIKLKDKFGTKNSQKPLIKLRSVLPKIQIFYQNETVN